MDIMKPRLNSNVVASSDLSDKGYDGKDLPPVCIREAWHEAERDTDGKNFKRDFALNQRVKLLVNDISIEGLKFVFRESVGYGRRFIWLLLVLFGTGLFIYQLYDRINYYMSNPTLVRIKVVNNQSMQFPSVTICNENLFNLTSFYEGGSSDYVKLVEHLQSPQIKGLKTPPINLTYAYDLLNKIKTFNSQELFNDNTPSWEKSIWQCYFGVEPCKDELELTETEKGRCVNFNTDGSKKIGHISMEAGLSLWMDAHQEIYYMSTSSTAGFTVTIHLPGDLPLIGARSINVEPNKHTKIKVEVEIVEDLPAPYGDCIEDANYYSSVCMSDCEKEWVLTHCGCTMMHHLKPGDNITLCDPIQTMTCALMESTIFRDGEALEQCGCKPQCKSVTFHTHATSAAISDFFIDYLIDNMPGNRTRQNLQKNFVQVDIFMPKFQYTYTKAVPGYTLLALMSDIGGALGLVLGSTVLTMVELLDFTLVTCIEAVADQVSKALNKKKQQKSLKEQPETYPYNGTN